ncbi:unnamed protein product [Spodoptera littoralis]|uniref:Uncharacterized protein n=1 Tax=Spodoptera littoralis TaxID=7109 RepID=A0A9P0IEF3_SPOLI|nr:unnamed protein product [Spodoptera littoralis]CAH1645239.1 unnamed protein product [Spodoptera littoralis]
MISSSTEPLSVLHFESRLSSNGPLKLPQIAMSQLPRFEDVRKPHGPPSLGQANTAPLSILKSSVLHKTSRPSFMNGFLAWPKKRSPPWREISLHLPRLPLGPWNVHQTPASLPQPVRPLPSPWAMRRSNSHFDTRKYMSGYRNVHPRGYISYPGSSYNEVLSLHGSELDPSIRFTKTAPFMPYRFFRRPRWTQSPHWIKDYPTLIHEHPSLMSIKHVSCNQLENIPSIHKQCPDLLKEREYRTQRQVRPQPLILLQELNNVCGRCSCCGSTHFVEDVATCLSGVSSQCLTGDGAPWLPDYSTDYSVVDVTRGSYFSPRLYIEPWKLSNLPPVAGGNCNRCLRLQFPSVYKQKFSDSSLYESFDHSLLLAPQPSLVVEQQPWCLQCLPMSPGTEYTHCLTISVLHGRW